MKDTAPGDAGDYRPRSIILLHSQHVANRKLVALREHESTTTSVRLGMLFPDPNLSKMVEVHSCADPQK